jgi:predicted DNA binding protein
MRVTLPAAEFALADLFERVPDARVECDSAVANPADQALLAVQTDERERAIDTAVRSDPSVAAADCFGERADGWTYRVKWEGRPRRLIQRLIAADVTLLSMRGWNGEWKLRLLAPDREGISQAYEIMTDLGCGADCRSITTLDGEGGGSPRSELTDEQRESLVEAFEAGYYNIPRDVTAEDVADNLDISHQALSERLRRGYCQLVKTELVATEENTGED